MARPDPIFDDDWYADLTRDVPDDFRRFRRAEIALKGLVDSAEDVARYEMNALGQRTISDRLTELMSKGGDEASVRAVADLLAVAAIYLHHYRRGDPLDL